MFVQCYGTMGCADFCSGTLIHENWFITAAHCVEQLQASDELFVLFGDNLDDYTSYSEVVSWIAHPGYLGMQSSYIRDDVALVELAGIIDPATREPVEIPQMYLNRDEITNGWIDTELQMVGFGITGTNRNDTGTKRTVSMPIYEFDDLFVYLYDGTDRQNICSGDSGGAALRRNEDDIWELVGVNSFTWGECESWYAGVARVDMYISWIEQYVDIVEPIPPPFRDSQYTDRKDPQPACSSTEAPFRLSFVLLAFSAVLFRRGTTF
jgi:secreted trypsin-like serine protease